MAVVRVAFFLSTGGLAGEVAVMFVPIRFRCIKLINGSAIISTLPFCCWAYAAIDEKPASRVTSKKPFFTMIFLVMRRGNSYIFYHCHRGRDRSGQLSAHFGRAGYAALHGCPPPVHHLRKS